MDAKRLAMALALTGPLAAAGEPGDRSESTVRLAGTVDGTPSRPASGPSGILQDAYVTPATAGWVQRQPTKGVPRAITPERPRLLQQTLASSAGTTALARAERLALRAESQGELTEVINACVPGEASEALPATDRAALRRLLAWAYNRRGELAIDAGDATRARKDFDNAIASDAGCWDAWHNRGISHAEQGRFREAIADLTRAIELNPRFATAYHNRGEVWLELADLERATLDLTAAIALGPVDPAALTSRGDANLQRGEIDRAVADYNLALSLAPDDAETLARRGDVYASVGNFSQAASDYAAAVRLDPNAAATRRSYAWLLATCPEPALRQPAEAVRHAQQGVRLATAGMGDHDRGTDDLALYLDTLAVALAADGRYERAAQQERRAVQVATPALRATLKQRLQRFERGQPVRLAPGER